jgi:hypothetical protein
VLEKAVVGLSIACLSPRHQCDAVAIAICGTCIRHLLALAYSQCAPGESATFVWSERDIHYLQAG